MAAKADGNDSTLKSEWPTHELCGQWVWFPLTNDGGKSSNIGCGVINVESAHQSVSGGGCPAATESEEGPSREELLGCYTHTRALLVMGGGV